MFLLDTNVVAELRKPHADQRVKRWAGSVAATSLFLSAISVLELETGVLRIERRDARQGKALRHWLEMQVLTAFADRVLPVDTAVARRCARLHASSRMAEGDALVAATALEHALTLVTRNTGDFKRAGVESLNPWQV